MRKYIEQALESTPLDMEDTFLFRCKACGKCCKNRKDIIFTPYDVYRLARFLGRTPQEIIERYCEIYEGEHTYMPVVWLKPVPPYDACPFLRGKKCSVHAAKPCVCRVFPLMRAYTVTGEAQYYLTDSCHSEGAAQIKVKDWIWDFGSEESNQVGRYWSDSIIRLSYAVNPARFSCKKEDRNRIFQTMAAMLYLPFEIEKPFLPQLERSVRLLIKHLEKRYSLVVPTMQEFIDIAKQEPESEG
jgi:Fe-S-cluster containining protein